MLWALEGMRGYVCLFFARLYTLKSFWLFLVLVFIRLRFMNTHHLRQPQLAPEWRTLRRISPSFNCSHLTHTHAKNTHFWGQFLCFFNDGPLICSIYIFAGSAEVIPPKGVRNTTITHTLPVPVVRWSDGGTAYYSFRLLRRGLLYNSLGWQVTGFWTDSQ